MAGLASSRWTASRGPCWRARALGRPGAGARRPRSRGRIPAACGHPDRRSRATSRPSARSGPGQPGALARSMRLAGYWRPQRPDLLTSSGKPAWSCSKPNSHSPRTAAAMRHGCCSTPPEDSRRSTCASRATRTSRRGPQRCSPAAWRAAASLLDVSRAAAAAPDPADPPLPCDLLLDGLALVFTEGRAAATPVLRRAVAAFASREVSVAGDAPLGLAGDTGGEPPVGLRQLSRDRHAHRSARPRYRGARGPRRRGQRVRPGRRLRRRLRDGRAAGRRGRGRQGGDRHPHRPPRRARAGGPPRTGGRGLRADRRASSRMPLPSARGPPSSTPTGRNPS